MSELYCKHCFQIFGRKSTLKRHLEHRPQICHRKSELIKQQAVAPIQAQFEKRVQKTEAKYKKIVDQLVYTNVGVRTRKKKVDDLQSQKKIQNFEKIVSSSNLSAETLKNTLKTGADGDLLLFKKIILEKNPREMRCVRIRDFARDKYQYFDGDEWITVPLQYIAENFMEQMRKQYVNIILGKHELLDEVNKQFPPWVYPEKNQAEYNRINDLYAAETTHFAKLTIVDKKLCTNIKNGIRAMLNTKPK